jgi:anti-sigma regulatory factor (Ser/Thr protein kinase)
MRISTLSSLSQVTSPTPEHAAPPRWEREFDARPEVLAEIRAGVATFARAHGAEDRVVVDMTLAVSEAATNAVMHAFLDRLPGRVSVIAESGDECLLLRVLDDGRGMVPRSDSPGLGIGLSTMATLASSCDIRDRAPDPGTEVRMTFAAPGVTGPPFGADVQAERSSRSPRSSGLPAQAPGPARASSSSSRCWSHALPMLACST